MQANTITDLIAAVEEAFRQTLPETLNKTFLSLQMVMECVIKARGDNQFKLPHKSKNSLIRQGILPLSFGCEKSIAEEVTTTHQEYITTAQHSKAVTFITHHLQHMQLDDE